MIIVPSNVTAIAGVTFKGANITDPVNSSLSTTSIAIPSHSAGDIIVMIATSEYTTQSIYGKPAAGGTVPTWNTIIASTNTSGALVCYAVATGSNTTSGSWTNYPSVLCCAVFSGQSSSSPIGDSATYNRDYPNGLSAFSPSITPQNTSGSSAIMRFGMLCFGDNPNPPLDTTYTLPAGYTQRAISNSANGFKVGATLITQDNTTSAADYIVNCKLPSSATVGRSIGITLEIKK